MDDTNDCGFHRVRPIGQPPYWPDELASGFYTAWRHGDPFTMSTMLFPLWDTMHYMLDADLHYRFIHMAKWMMEAKVSLVTNIAGSVHLACVLGDPMQRSYSHSKRR